MDETSSDEEYGPLASTWGDQAKDTSTDVIQAWRSLADPNAKLGPKGLGSGGLHRRGKNYIPVDEEVILKQREKTASMRPKSSKSKSTRSSNGSSSNISGKKQGPNEKKMPRAKNGVYKKEQTQPQQRQEPDHWNPFRSTSTPSPDSQPVWLKETAYSYFRSREKTLDDAGHRVPASWGDPLPLPTPQEEPTPSKSKSASALFSDTTTNSMTSPPPSPPSSTSTASISRFELPSRRPPPKGSKFVWLDQPLSNQPFWEQPKVNAEKNNQRMEDAKASVMEKRTSWDQKMSTNQNQDRSSSKWEISQQQHNIEGSRVTNAEGRNVSELPKADWGNTTLDTEKSKAPTTKPATKRRVRFNDNTIKPEYHEGKEEEEIKSAPKWDNAKSYQQPKSQTQVDDSWGKTNFAAGPSAYDWKDVEQEVSDIVNNAEASSKTGSNGNKADVATSEWNKSTTAATSAASWNETTSSSWQQEAAATWYDTSQWNSATTFSPGTTTEWGNGVASDWNTSSNDNCGSTATTSADTWSSHKDVSTPQRFSRPERPKYSKRGTAPRPMNYRQDIPIAPPKEVAPPPSAENPVIVSINVELGPGQKIPIKIRLLDDTDRLAQEFAASHNITVPPIVDALRQLFSSQKRIAVKKRSRKM